MISAFGRAFRTPDLRRKLLFTLGIMAVYRFGAALPTPGVSYPNAQQCIAEASEGSQAGIYAMINLFSGGALLQLSVLALGIMPYITASIILQLLTVVIPRLEELKKEGSTGTAQITQYTRYLTIGLAVLQSTTLIAVAARGGLFPNCSYPIIPDQSPTTLGIMVLTMTAGTALVMWLGERITENGIGNGMSILIFTSIAATFPGSIWAIRSSNGIDIMLLVIAIGLVIMGMVIFVEQCQRRVPVQYAKKMVGRRMYGGTNTYIPIKVNMAGVIPVIFASSMLYLPVLLAQFNAPEAGEEPKGWVTWITNNVASGEDPLYVIFYLSMIVFFTFFYVSITFNPDEVADDMRKYGGFVPGYRSGRPTAEYLNYIVSRITSAGAVYLALVSAIPLIALVLVNADQNFPFGGASILIVVGVGLDTVKQIDSQLQQREYEGFLR